MKDMNKLLLHPIRMRIIQELSETQQMTASEICEKTSDVPRTTIYRHIKTLIENEILWVISEKKIRGSLERTLSLNISKIREENTIENAAENAFGFFMMNYTKFQRYFHGKNPDPGRDKVFMNNRILMLSDEEYDDFLRELQELFIKYHRKPAEGRRARDLSIISSPPDHSDAKGEPEGEKEGE